MYLIVGLGNPEKEYANTRHNVGFDTVNELAKRHEIEINRNKFNSLYGQGIIHNEKVIILKPQTYMNLSGIAVRNFKDFYKIDLDKIIIVHDDIDIEEGKIKLRKIGGPGTHNGMKSVVHELNSTEFPRIRIGTGSPDDEIDLKEFGVDDVNELKDYVLEKIDDESRSILDEAIINAAKAIEEILENGIDIAMNKFN